MSTHNQVSGHPPPSPIPLSDLPIGHSGVIVALRAAGVLRRRLMEMGLVTHATVKLERVAPLGDPLAFLVKGYRLSLRRAEAGQIMVVPVEAAGCD